MSSLPSTTIHGTWANAWPSLQVGRLLVLKQLSPLRHLFDPTAADKTATHPCVLIAKRRDYGIVLVATSTVYDDLLDRVQAEHAVPLQHPGLEHFAGARLQLESRRDVAGCDDCLPDSGSSEEDEDVDGSVRSHLQWKPASTVKAGFLQFSRMYVVQPHEVATFKELGKHFRLDARSLLAVQTKLIQGDEITTLRDRAEQIMDAAEQGRSLLDVDIKYEALFQRLNLPLPRGRADRYSTRAGRMINRKGLAVNIEVSELHAGWAKTTGQAGAKGEAQDYSRHINYRPLAAKLSGPVDCPWANGPCSPSTRRPSRLRARSRGTSVSISGFPESPVPFPFYEKRLAHYLSPGAKSPCARSRFAPNAVTQNVFDTLSQEMKADHAEIEDIIAQMGGMSLDHLSAHSRTLLVKAPASLRGGFRCANHGGEKGVCACVWETRPCDELMDEIRERIGRSRAFEVQVSRC